LGNKAIWQTHVTPSVDRFLKNEAPPASASSDFDMVSKGGFSMASMPMTEKIFSNHLNLKAFVTIAQGLGVISGK